MSWFIDTVKSHLHQVVHSYFHKTMNKKVAKPFSFCDGNFAALKPPLYFLF